MTAEIICVGTELLLGDILNTNAQFLSRELAELGISVLHQHVIGDNPARLRELVTQAKSRSDLLIFSGGLGPTEDDLTKETVAEVFGDTLHFDETEWDKILAFFARTNRRPTENNRKQAMWLEQVRPLLLARQNCTIHSHTLRVLGGESAIASKVAPLFESTNPTAAIYCKTGECEIRVTARETTPEAAEAACRERLEEFRRILGAAAYDVDVPALEYTVVRVLRENGLHAATAESCTGGMIAERLTNVPGSSEVFGYGFVTYAEAAKQKLLGVPAETIAQYNVVSGPVAAAMAFGAAKESGAELAVGITGLAGPGGELPGKPVGTVYLAGADARTNTGCLMRLTLGGYRERSVIRARAAMYALDMLRRMALGLPVPDSLAITPDTPATTMDI